LPLMHFTGACPYLLAMMSLKGSNEKEDDDDDDDDDDEATEKSFASSEAG
jgi:hypothetical protein